MTSTKNSQTVPFAPENLSKSVEASMAAALSLPQKIVETNLDAAGELLNFMSRRVKSQADFLRDIGHCKDLAGAVEMQRKFWSHISDDYGREMGQLSEMAKGNIAKATKLVAEGPAS